MKWNKKNVEQYKENESEVFDKELQELKIESKFEKQLQESEEELKSDTQNNWLKKDDDPENEKLYDNYLALFLNGLIIEKRGKKEASTKGHIRF